MRATLVALLVGSLLAVGAFAPVAAAGRVPKVALIVGPVGSLTSTYRHLADEAAAVAHDAGAEVVRVYSPNATWPAVKAALSGASIVVYLGHGNGWPSRYRDSLFPPSQNGFGLNPVAGVDDAAHQYFGEASMDQVRLAGNAVVLLHHLCYASGNTEPGLPEGTLSDATQRVDNYAAGFLRAGARAVIAEAHLGPAYYVRQLLTTTSSVEQIWNRSPNANGHTLRYASVRTPGYTARLDPDNASSGFYRSIVSRGVTASDLQASAVGTPGGVITGPPAEPSLANQSLRFGQLQLRTLPIAATSTKLILPLASGAADRIPKGAQIGLRWDPILLDPAPESAPPAVDPSVSPAPSAPAAPEGPSPEPAAPTPAIVDPSVPLTEAPTAWTQPTGLFTLPDPSPAPDATPAPTPEATPGVVIPTEAPAVDLVVPEVVGSVVNLAPATRGSKGLTVGVRYPAAPGLYRLVATIHTPAGVAYDAATQALLTPLLVRVGGPVAVAYGVPAALSLPAGASADLPVRVVNAGSEAWDLLVTSPATKIADELLHIDRRSRVPATLVATWVSVSATDLPAQRTVRLDPDVSGPGHELTVSLGLSAPSIPGSYLLLLDVVSPSRGALSALGSQPAIIRVTVTDPGPSPTPVPPQRG